MVTSRTVYAAVKVGMVRGVVRNAHVIAES